ncbi:MAG: monofunctional biosynthetic peptidoglycan transglycosylase [Gammaproteobacteria bacterium]|nr:monofunctional biosynthetic peptidoglycan transglycosylase [Gammaproteobacteria bacterium]MCP4982246.1 monofunctional biosynthetic peptidoglycan transglycosylase [Gammaproteobacteria bacterium]
MASRLPQKIKSMLCFPFTRRALRWGLRLLLLMIILDLGYLVAIWPSWENYTKGPIQRSNFIRTYASEQPRQSDWPKLRWNPVSITKISKHMIRAVIVAEDSRFYEHDGIDLEALKEAMEYNLSEKTLAYGASTISQQTVKNVFLSPSKNPLRKWHELVLTLVMEKNLSKKRILEHYLNLAEFGRGIYGVEAAARYYWRVPAARLTSRQAIELAATLPSPVKNNPRTRSSAFQKRVRKIRRHFKYY